jgi:hypothetical protein
MDLILIALCAPLALIAVWLLWAFVTWATADDGAWFGKPAEGRVTFKQVLINSLIDVRDLLGLRQIWAWAVKVWRYCGETLGSLILTFNAYIVATPDLKAVLTSTPYGLAIWLAINFFAFITVRNAIEQRG